MQQADIFKKMIDTLNGELKPLLDEKLIEDVKRDIREGKIRGLKNAIESLEAMLSIEENKAPAAPAMAILEIADTRSNTNEFIYPASKTWAERIKAYMRYKNMPVKIIDLVAAFKPFEPEYSEDKLRGALNNTVQTMYKEGALKIYEPPKKEKGFYYGSPSWFDGDKIMPEHVPPPRKSVW